MDPRPGGHRRPPRLPRQVRAESGLSPAGWRPAGAPSPFDGDGALSWQHSNYEGRFFLSSNSTSDVGSYMNDRTTSVWTRTSRTVCMYRHEGYVYDMGCYGAGGSTGVLPILNDELTSFRLV
ncbi:peptidase inhibitor family I36 protein [Streptomyces exfoliatus]|uniref:peptidase inhibitor family I36 protein n=1 Tax=Streptomyces exfoliatus TaxID=1905 RepID=UPI00099B7A92|nr:peptidase inhibitor family I36 protein [Streptomyces exfoliatus]